MSVNDEPAHQILSYTLLFLLFHYFLYIADPPLCTPCQCDCTRCDHTHLHTTLTFASSDQPHLFDGQMFYNSHALFPFLVAQHVPSCAWPIMNPCAMQSGTYYSFASDEPCACFLVYHLYLTCLYLLFTREHCIYKFIPQNSDLVCSAWSFHLTLLCTFALLCTSDSPCTPCYHTRILSITPLLHPQSLIRFTLWSSLIAHSCWSSHTQGMSSSLHQVLSWWWVSVEWWSAWYLVCVLCRGTIELVQEMLTWLQYQD